MIKIQKLTVEINEQVILDNINLEINRGDYMAIVGDNGVGKTTLLKTILGLKNYQKGEIYIDNTSIKEFNGWNKIGYVQQRHSISHDFPITVKEYLNLYTKDKQKLYKLMEIFEIKELLNKKLLTLSGGQFQKVNIVKSLVNDINYLILDEPNTGLDKQKRSSLYKLLHNLTKKGITVIIVTHSIEEIANKIHKVYDLQTQKLTEVNKDDCNYC